MTKKTKTTKELRDKVTEMLAGNYYGNYGEDGLTIWDFARLRDDTADLIHQERERWEAEVTQVIDDVDDEYDDSDDEEFYGDPEEQKWGFEPDGRSFYQSGVMAVKEAVQKLFL